MPSSVFQSLLPFLFSSPHIRCPEQSPVTLSAPAAKPSPAVQSPLPAPCRAHRPVVSQGNTARFPTRGLRTGLKVSLPHGPVCYQEVSQEQDQNAGTWSPTLSGLQLPGPSELDIFVLTTSKYFFRHGLVTSKLLHAHNILQRRVLLAGGTHKHWGYPEYLRISSSPQPEFHSTAPQPLQQIAKSLL